MLCARVLFLGDHTFTVQRGLRYGMVLFIISEVMFFFTFFWAFFHASLSPTFQINCVWPPLGFQLLVFKFFWCTLVKYIIIIIIRGYYHMGTSFFNKRCFCWNDIGLSLYNIFCFIIYMLASVWIFRSCFYDFWWYLWVNFLSSYRFSWFSCYNWYVIHYYLLYSAH